MNKILLFVFLAMLSTSLFADDYALHFDGSGYTDRVIIPNNPALSPAYEMTVEAWVKPDSIILVPTIIGNEEWLTSEDGFILRIENNSFVETPQFVIGTSNGWYRASASSGSIPLHVWTHVAGTFDGSNVRIFINGVQAGSTPCVETMQPSVVDLRIGGHYYTYANRQWFGVIDEVRLWNIARTETEIYDNKENPLTGSEPGLVGLWRMQTGSGSIAVDSTANDFDGTIYGATWVDGYPMSPFGIDDDPEQTSTRLIDNVPNPCNTTTTIRYSIRESGSVRIEVYNLLGQLIETPFDESKSAGFHTYEWNISDLGTGIYFFKLTAREQTSIRKMMHIR